MNKKNIVRWLCLLLIVTVAGAAALVTAPKAEAAPAGLVLEDMPIVLPANATDVEKNAAKELQYYLREITGSSSPVITENMELESAIYIGATKFADANNVTYPDNNGNGEGWVIKAIGENLVLTGGETRGTIYAVYHLLEDEFGVHWWTFWDEYVPTMETAVLPFGFESSGEPAFVYRDIYIGAEGTANVYFARNRLNGFASNADQSYGGEEDFSRPYHVHTFNRYFKPFYEEPQSPADAKWLDAVNPDGISWYEEHPDWYAWSDVEGKRISHGQMCMSNEEFIEAFAERVLIAIEMSYEEADAAGKARPKYADITPNDLPGGFCQCDDCKATLAASGPSGQLLQFVNKIAAVVAEEYPEMTVETLAYWQYFDVPLDDTIPADNVVIRMANSDRSVVHSLQHEANTESRKRLEAWAKILKPGQLWMWDYAINTTTPSSYPDYFRYYDDYKMFHQMGGSGIFTELEFCNSLEFWDMKVWLMTKIMENPYLDLEAYTWEFLTKFYGEAAAQDLLDYLNMSTDLIENYDTKVTFGTNVNDVPWMTAEDALQGYRLFDAAAEKTRNDPSISEEEREVYLARINAARSNNDLQILNNYNRYAEEMGKLNDPDQIFDVNKTEIGRRYVATLKWLRDQKPVEDHTGVQDLKERGNYDAVKARLAGFSVYDMPLNKVEQNYPYLEIPQQIYDDHPGISSNHIYDFPSHMIVSAASYMSGMYDLPGKASYYGGTAIMWDLEELYATTEKDYVDNMYTFSEDKRVQTSMSKSMYLNDPVVADGQWHLYRIQDVVAAFPTFKQFRFFGDTIYVDLLEYPHLVNVPVDMYVSMKVEGDPTGKDSRNYGKIYVDRFIIVENCNVNYNEQIPATCDSNAKQKGYCIVCGKENLEEFPYTKLPHTITSDYIYDAVNNVYTADCDVCGKAEFRYYGELPEEVMADVAANGSSLDFVYEMSTKEFKEASGGLKIIEDTDSAVGAAAFFDVATKLDYLAYYQITDETPLAVAYHTLPRKLYAKDIVTDGEYHIYKFEDTPLVTNDNSRLILFDWSMQVEFGELPIKGQKVDVYMSMKVDGELKYDDPSNMPCYYIDRFIVVGSCASHKTSTYTYDAVSNTYTGACDNCGGVIKKTYVDELPQEVLDQIAVGGTNVAHIHEYGYDKLYGGLYDATVFMEADADAAGGKTLVYDTAAMTRAARIGYFTFGASKPFALTTYTGGHVFGSIPAATLKENSNDGKYHLYHWNNVLIPKDHIYTWGFDWSLQLNFNDIKANLEGKILDGYLSMKIDGDPTYTGSVPSRMAKYYLDRMIIVDNCKNHMEQDTLTVTTSATCDSNALADGICSLCGGKISGIEVEGTRLSHDFGEFVADPETGLSVATCKHGCGTTRTKGDLPQTVLDDLAAAGIDKSHAHEYGADSFSFLKVLSVVEDSGSATGIAARARARDSIDPGLYILYSHESFAIGQSTGNKLADMTYSMLYPNCNGEYKIYKWEDLKLDDNMEYLTLFDGDLMVPDMAELAGKIIDLYVSMRIENIIHADTGDDKYPIYYVDRVIAVDNCDQYPIDAKYPCLDNELRVDNCPVCGKEITASGATAEHIFTKYEQDELKPDEYIAYCDNGCGATDTKIRQSQSLEESLPAELPQSVKNHVVVSYTVADGEIQMEGLRWDFDLNRPVGVRSYDEAESNGLRNALNMSMARYLPVNLWRGGDQTEILGNITPDVMKANSGKGYQLYLLDDIVPIKYNEYRYLYMFVDWGVYIEMFDDDLRDYKNQVLDVYLYMKVEGDPYCADGENVTYYIDQLLVASACEVDESWTIEKEATCTETGIAVGDCKVCGLKGSVVNTAKLPHTVTNGAITVEPTCEDNMIINGYCTTCNQDYQNMQVPNSTLTHSFTNYVKQTDGSGREIAYCDHGCGERHIRNSVSTGSNLDLPENIQQILPVIGKPASHGVSFSDIKSSDWYFDAVKEAVDNKLINGVTATEFRPNETLTVAQAVKLASAYHEMNYTGDVTLENGSGNWYSSYVDYAVENGIIDRGYASKSNAEMNKPIDRSEFVSIFVKAMDEGSLTGYNTVADNAIPDVKADDANADAIYKFYRAGILTGSDAKGTFNPHSSIKRSEVATILSRMYNENVRQSITLN